MKNKRGFTLVELSVVMAVTAIVIAMASSFLVTYAKCTYALNNNTDKMNDITNIQTTVNDWISEHDNENYIFSLDGNSIKTVDGIDYNTGVKVIKTSSEETVSEILKIADGKITLQKSRTPTGGNTENFEPVEIVLNTIELADFTLILQNGKAALIKCKAIRDDNEYNELAFSILSATSRDRYSYNR